MCRFNISHGDSLLLESGEVVPVVGDSLTASAAPLAPFHTNEVDDVHWPVGFLFPDLQKDSSNLLPEGDETAKNLRALADTMKDDRTAPGAPIPTIYTFFGQFVDHDITLATFSKSISDISKNNPRPISFEQTGKDQLEKLVVNSRSPNLELDSVYSPYAPWDPNDRAKMLLGKVSHPEGLPDGKEVYNDLPRHQRSTDLEFDRMALIGDTRNDENVILAQLHVAFLHAHNALVDQGKSFDEARKLLIQHYQWIVLHDFLERVADPEIVTSIRDHKQDPFFDPVPGEFFMPLEFSVAAYRFGHSKVREVYLHYNNIQTSPDLSSLFTFGRSGGNLAGFPNIPGVWVIEWKNFLSLDDPEAFPRPIDTTLSETLLNIGGENGQPGLNLAAMNLLRGYVLRIPTGQAVANAMRIEPLAAEQIETVAARLNDKGKQLEALRKGNFQHQTPLWFYILAEAAYYHGGKHLGPVGSTIVAEVLIGVLRNSEYSILGEPDWEPRLKGRVKGKFDLADLLILAGVLKPKPD
jgi:hypothetical protein